MFFVSYDREESFEEMPRSCYHRCGGSRVRATAAGGYGMSSTYSGAQAWVVRVAGLSKYVGGA